jgi:hypothetical protein
MAFALVCVLCAGVLAFTFRRSPSAEFTGYDYYIVMRVSDEPLFRANGTVNEYTLEKLLTILDDPRLPSGVATAADFSNFVVPEPGCMNHSGAVIIQLFETIPNRNGIEHGHLTEFTRQWWQLVYRTADDESESDVLTLWMVQPYRLTHFNGTRFDIQSERPDIRFADFTQDNPAWYGIPMNGSNTIAKDERIADGLPACNNYFFEGNYGVSIVRSNLLRDLRFLLNTFAVERYLVAPVYLPGQWQSAKYQTGTAAGRFYATGAFSSYDTHDKGSAQPGNGLGAAGLIWVQTAARFSLMNGKDGLSIGPFYNQWPNTLVVPTHYDLLWLPSDFEIRSQGHDREAATFQTFAAEPRNPQSPLRWNYINRENDHRQDLTGGRSGLWELNGFDRAFDSATLASDGSWETRLTWLRTADTFGVGNANTVYHSGNRYTYGVNQQAGMRPALHLSITCLR